MVVISGSVFKFTAIDRLLEKLNYKALVFDPNPRTELENGVQMKHFQYVASRATIFKCSDEDLTYMPPNVEQYLNKNVHFIITGL